MAASSRSTPEESKASKLPIQALHENMQELYALLNAYKAPEQLTEEFNAAIATKYTERLQIEAEKKIRPNYSESKVAAEIEREVEKGRPFWREQRKTPREVEDSEKSCREVAFKFIKNRFKNEVEDEVNKSLAQIQRDEYVRLETNIREYNPSILAKIEVIIKNLQEINIPGDFKGDDKINSVENNPFIKNVLDSTINGHLLIIYVLKCYDKGSWRDAQSRAKFYTRIVTILFEKGAGQHLSFFQQKELLYLALGYLFTHLNEYFISSSFANLPLEKQHEEVKVLFENSVLFKLLSSKKIAIEILNQLMDQKIAEFENNPVLKKTDVMLINMLLDVGVNRKLTPAFINKVILFQRNDVLGVFLRSLDFYRAHLPSESHTAASSSSGALTAPPVSEVLEKRKKLILDVFGEICNLALQIGKESGEAKEAEAKLERALSALKIPSLTSGPALFSGSSSAALTGLTASLSSLASSSEGTKPVGSGLSFKRGREAV